MTAMDQTDWKSFWDDHYAAGQTSLIEPDPLFIAEAVQLPPGALARQMKMRKELDALGASVVFAGDGLYRASMEVSLRTGYEAADRILGKG